MVEVSDPRRISKKSIAVITSKYASSAPYEDVKGFYLSEMRQRGWAFEVEEPIEDWGREFGGRVLTFVQE
jgi:hypothetical protein